MEYSLAAEDLVKRFNKREVVRKLSVTLKQGQIVGLLGPNGAGKTTTFQIISGEMRADEGKIWFNNNEITDWPMYKRARLGIGYLPQEASAFRGMTTEENVIAVLEMNHYSKQEVRDRLEKVLTEFNMHGRRKIKARDLSGGERRRLEVMRAMSLHPHFLLLDEPFAGVDPIAVEDLQKIVADLKHKNVGVLITDHNVHETLSITDRAYIIYEGQVLIEGTPETIIHHDLARKIFLGEKFKLRSTS